MATAVARAMAREAPVFWVLVNVAPAVAAARTAARPMAVGHFRAGALSLHSGVSRHHLVAAWLP